jgi:serine/threonine protein kinase
MQEARAASKIGHENIIDITDFGETPSGSVFFVMEFLDGNDLAHHIREGGPMPLPRIRTIMNQLCRALGAAHGKGIIHRDLKPENIYLIEREGRPDFVKVLDFGIAKISGFDDSGSRLTRTGMIFGTPEYMSPEQARGDRPDHRVDIYAVGCILYEMLTGDVPFHAETFMGVLTKHMFEAPEPPSRRAPTAGVPMDLEAVVMKALAKDRDQRFQSMKEMAVALEAGLGGDVAQAWGEESSRANISMPGRENSQALKLATPTSSPGELPADAPKSKAGFLVAGLLGLGLLGGGAWYVLRPAPAIDIKPVVTAPAVGPDKPVEPSTPKPETNPVAATPPAKPARILIRSKPSDADIFNGDELLGRTSASVNVPAGQEQVVLTVKKRGFKDYSLPFVPSQDRAFEITLLADKKASSSSSKSTPSSKTPSSKTPSTKAPESKPETKPESKPTGKLRDLKDPFAN